MLKIIGGEYRSRQLYAPEGMDTRPTLGSIRESLFNILRLRVTDVRVLDLFAGSGALAFEALSRGAAYAVMADKDRRALDAIKKNIALLHCEETARAEAGDCFDVLSRLCAQKEKFGLIFLDPPYKIDTSPVMAAIMQQELLTDDGMIVAERAKKSVLTLPDSLAVKDERIYGITALTFISKKGENK